MTIVIRRSTLKMVGLHVNGITGETTEPHESYSNFNNQLYRLVNSLYMRKTLLST